ncbi:protein msta-like [Cimex lectularius]|uniref:MYND-type domain-containing protein n=1 Tax=Cimex lectularius TaxID=79782 RepID=A0A8I6RS22_CIMLE|nr:protein msta-like [Cimex lectularius]
MCQNSKCPICNAKGGLLCGACREVSYCSKEHQREHWKIHKTACHPYEVKRSPDLGRYLTCKRDIEIHGTILTELPLVFGPKFSSPTPQCLGCYQPLDLDNIEARCPKCNWPACSADCPGLTHRHHHLQECLVFSLNTDTDELGYYYEAVTPLRCLLLQKRNPKKWDELMSMESHIKKRGKDSDVYEETDQIAQYLVNNFLCKLDHSILPKMSVEIIHVICGILEVNAMDIGTGNGELSALYPNACLMEHSCIPNTRYMIQLEDFKITVLSSQNLKKGDHVATMYTHMLWGTAARLEHLKNTKYFVCKCKRCQDPTELGTNLSTLKCIGTSPDDINTPCTGLILPQNSVDDNSDWKCTQCPVILTGRHVADLMSRIAADVDATLESPSVKKLQDFLLKLEKLVHKNHYHCFMLKHSLVQLLGREDGYTHDKMSNEDLQKKIDMCKDLLDVSSTLDVENTRVVLYNAVILLELFLTMFEQYNRTKGKLEKSKLLEEGKAHLENCIYILRFEPLSSSGSRIANVCKGHLFRIKNELKKYEVIEL